MTMSDHGVYCRDTSAPVGKTNSLAEAVRAEEEKTALVICDLVDDNGPVELQRGRCVKHMQHHRAPAQTMERLRPVRLHPRPLTRGHNDHRQRPMRWDVFGAHG